MATRSMGMGSYCSHSCNTYQNHWVDPHTIGRGSSVDRSAKLAYSHHARLKPRRDLPRCCRNRISSHGTLSRCLCRSATCNVWSLGLCTDACHSIDCTSSLSPWKCHRIGSRRGDSRHIYSIFCLPVNQASSRRHNAGASGIHGLLQSASARNNFPHLVSHVVDSIRRVEPDFTHLLAYLSIQPHRRTKYLRILNRMAMGIGLLGLGPEWSTKSLLEFLAGYDGDYRPLGVWDPALRSDAAKMERPSTVHPFTLDIV